MLYFSSFHIFAVLLQLIFATPNITEHDFSESIDVPSAIYRGAVPKTVYGGSCRCPNKGYVVGTQKVTWFQAFVICQQYGMELATVLSPAEEAEVEEVLGRYSTTPGVNHGYWIAATRNGACNSEFVWLTQGRPLVYSNFAPGQPDNAGGIESCVEIFIDNQGKYLWNDLPCSNDNNRIGFVCQNRCCLT